MKKFTYLTVFTLLLIVFYGCPVGLDYPLGNPGKEKIDNSLVGTWQTDNSDAEVVKLSISTNDSYSYKVQVVERGELYSLTTDDLTGWVTKLNKKSFFYVKPSDEEKYYHYMLKEISGNSMVTCDVSLLVGGVDAVTSSESLREEVLGSMKRDDFCTETISWYKSE